MRKKGLRCCRSGRGGQRNGWRRRRPSRQWTVSDSAFKSVHASRSLDGAFPADVGFHHPWIKHTHTLSPPLTVHHFPRATVRSVRVADSLHPQAPLRACPRVEAPCMGVGRGDTPTAVWSRGDGKSPFPPRRRDNLCPRPPKSPPHYALYPQAPPRACPRVAAPCMGVVRGDTPTAFTAVGGRPVDTHTPHTSGAARARKNTHPTCTHVVTIQYCLPTCNNSARYSC